MDPTKTARVKVQIGVSRQQANSSSNERPSDIPAAPKVSEFAFSSNTALINYCDTAFLRTKRKLNPDNTKVLTVDSDYKLKKSASNVKVDKALEAVNGTSDEPTTLGPRVEIINGKIVLKESSLMIANQDAQLVEGEYEEIEEGIHATSRYSSFLSKKKAKAWGIEETRVFYKALQQCGTEFSIMESYFPERTRKELKLKFFREENLHPELIKRTLESSVPLELDIFEEMLNTDKTPTVVLTESDKPTAE